MFATVAAGWNTDQFKYWFPQYSSLFQSVMVNNCSALYHQYVIQNVTLVAEQEAPNGLSVLTAPLITCILNNVTEAGKANMAAAGVLLGLSPTFLALLGSSTIETAAISVVAHRPLLTLCLALGSPVVSPLRLFNTPDIKAMLRKSTAKTDEQIHFHEFQRGTGLAVAAIEYLLALAAIANVANVSYQLGIQTISSTFSETTYTPLLWAFAPGVVHLGGTLSLHLRIRVVAPVHEPDVARTRPSAGFWSRWRRFLALEFSTAGSHKAPLVEFRGERWTDYAFLFVSWLTAFATVLVMVFGTMLLSSVLFISARDAVNVILRYTASVVCCQLIVAYELAGLRHIYAL